jgi:hypothetical protein
MKEQVFKVVRNDYTPEDFSLGVRYTLTNNGCKDSMGYSWTDYLESPGETLFERWCSFWKPEIRDGAIAFELIEEESGSDKKEEEYGRIYLQFLDAHSDSNTEISFRFEGDAQTFFENVYKFARALSFEDSTILKYMKNPYDVFME